MSLTMKQVKKKNRKMYWMGQALKTCSLLAFSCGIIILAFGTPSQGWSAGLYIAMGSLLFIWVVIVDRRFWKRMFKSENTLHQLKQETLELEAKIQRLREEP